MLQFWNYYQFISDGYLTPLSSFIENYGTHVITSITIGGRDVIYVKQHQSSLLTEIDIKNYVKDIGDQRFLSSESQPAALALKYKDKVSYVQSFLFGLWFCILSVKP